ncbi:MAG: hypothetical protein V3U29_05405, partial [Phycisphaeraceae bacterium]
MIGQRLTYRLFLIAGGFLWLAQAALGDDLNSPPWRGEEGSTVQAWEFNTEPGDWSNIPPDGIEPPLNNPYGSPAAEADCGAMCTPVWEPNFEGREGVVFADTFDLHIPNRTKSLQGKDIWLQVVYQAQDPLEVTIIPEGPDAYTVTLLREETSCLAGQWKH